VAGRDCEECRQWVFNTKTGEREWNPRTKGHVKRAGRPPCRICPKTEGNEVRDLRTGRKAELSRKNRRTLRLYFQHRAAGGVVMDAITRRNFGTLLWLFESHDRELRRALLQVPRL